MVSQPRGAGDNSRRNEDGERGFPRVLLASRSPRRRAMLADYGVPHEAVHPGIDDALLHEPALGSAVTPEQWVASLAYLKAAAGATLPEARELPVILGADTICVQHGRLVGTPRDEGEALQMLVTFRNAEHLVLTGVALLVRSRAGGVPRRHVFVDQASVRMGDVSDDQITLYLASGAWRGKAGAYNLSERIEAGWPIEYDGDPTTIMGLPMRKLVGRLRGLAATDAGE